MIFNYQNIFHDVYYFCKTHIKYQTIHLLTYQYIRYTYTIYIEKFTISQYISTINIILIYIQLLSKYIYLENKTIYPLKIYFLLCLFTLTLFLANNINPYQIDQNLIFNSYVAKRKHPKLGQDRWNGRKLRHDQKEAFDHRSIIRWREEKIVRDTGSYGRLQGYTI